MNEYLKQDILDLLHKADLSVTKFSEIYWNDRFTSICSSLKVELPHLVADISDNHVSSHYYYIFKEIISALIENIDGFIADYEEKGALDSVKLLLGIVSSYEKLVETRSFFKQLGYFHNNIVIIGANGSGKTFLTSKFKDIITNKTGVVIPAQKILIIPSYNGILSTKSTQNKLKEMYETERNSRVTYDTTKEDSIPYSYMKDSGGEFKTLIDNLLSENNELVHKRHSLAKQGLAVNYEEQSNLEKTLGIWNFLVEHRHIKCEDGINILLEAKDIIPYSIYKMSDGEKVILYNIAHVLQAPKGSIIIVDEPEMFLHRTILNKLWDKLEIERSDCLFVYITHDLEFASSRTSSQKCWIKSFEFSNEYISQSHKWELEPLPNNEIPEELLMRILGSRKKILFCEGKKDKSYDSIILEILFPNLTISPVESCKDVINYTKAFNKIQNKNVAAIGLVDSDFRTKEELNSLKRNSVFSFSVAEIENLLLHEEFLKLFSVWIRCSKNTVSQIKQKIINQLEKEKAMQVSNIISSKIQYIYTASHIGKGNTKDEVINKLQEFSNRISIDKWYADEMAVVEDIIKRQDYDKTILVCNNKGLFVHANKVFNIGNFQDRAIQFLKENIEAQSILRGCFPKEISG